MSLIHQFVLSRCSEKLIAVAIIGTGYLRPQSTASVFTLWKSAALAPQRGQTHRTNRLHDNEPLCAGAALVDRGSAGQRFLRLSAEVTTDSKARVVARQSTMVPGLPRLPLVHRGSRCFVLRPFPTGVTSEWWTGISFPSPLPRPPSSHLILSVLIQVRDPDRGGHGRLLCCCELRGSHVHVRSGRRAEAAVSQRGLDKRRQRRFGC